MCCSLQLIVLLISILFALRRTNADERMHSEQVLTIAFYPPPPAIADVSNKSKYVHSLYYGHTQSTYIIIILPTDAYV